jgi:hypothetical protein
MVLGGVSGVDGMIAQAVKVYSPVTTGSKTHSPSEI